ncbi:triose-phosphate transporter family-domain-containing protein [Apiospora rasikravindrae]|uniref:Triose-phosphate transporter family-domain-containing protein n=1 Tax=Apiospora rasikravindrae TaxID=990691 RepID=A0ABR1RPP4_9PEZI
MAGNRDSNDTDRKLEAGTATAPAEQKKDGGLHPALYIALWIAMSSSVILFNKWVLSSAEFNFPMFLTTWHMLFATAMTQLLARSTRLLDSRHQVPMTAATYRRAIVPIGVLFSLSLICGNLAYLYLSVSFIQMLKATNSVATLLTTWLFRIAPPNLKVLANVSVIVLGVVVASFGEIKFHMLGFIYQIAGIVFEALRLVMVQRLLSSPDFKMDPMVSLYYYAPACAVINGVLTAFVELPRLGWADISAVGVPLLVANAFVAFLLNVAVVLLIGKTSAVVLTMSGVLKDILLVAASMAIFRDPVTAQQFFGYAVALGGLVYYRLGADKMQAAAADARRQFAQYRQQYPGRVRALLLAALGSCAVALWLWGPSPLGEYAEYMTARPPAVKGA